MAHHLIKRFSQGERLIHWLQMLTFLLLVLTGVGLYAKSFFGLTRLFGGVDTSRAIHHYAGIVFIFSSVALFFQWFKDFTAPAEDSLGEVIRGYLDHNIHPKSGKMNAGQKLLGLCTGLFAVVMILTGLAMWFPFFLGRGMQQWMYFLHNLVFIFFMLLMIVHVYLGTAGNPGTWRAITRGTVTKAWAKKHHPKWEGEEA